MATTLKRPPSPVAPANPESHLSPITPADRKTRGKQLRDAVPRDAHAAWRAHAGREDPISILRAADATRQPELVPLRYWRISPFTFYRGSARARLRQSGRAGPRRAKGGARRHHRRGA